MRWKVIAGWMAPLLVAGGLSAQGEAPPPAFNFSPPGARAVAMGGAFIALSDDATASESNPAGLIQLAQTEVSAHYRDSESDQFTSSVFSDTGESISLTSSSGRLSFGSFVKPFDKWAVSAYFASTASLDGSASDTVESVVAGGPVQLASRQELDLDQVGAAVAVRLGERLALGATLRQSRLDVRLENQLPAPILDTSVLEDDDTDLTLVLGLLINPGGRLSAGLVFEQGGSYTVTQRINEQSTPISLDVPDVLGLGLAWRPSDRLVLLLDVKEISYGDLNSLYPRLLSKPNVEALGTETELNLGAEYAIPLGEGQTTLFLRGGAIRDPDHDGFVDQDTGETIPTLGVGLAGSGSWQADLGASFGDKAQDVVVSFIYRF